MITDTTHNPLGAFTFSAKGADKKRWAVAEVLLRERTMPGKMPTLNDVCDATREASELSDDEVDVRLMMEELAK